MKYFNSLILMLVIAMGFSACSKSGTTSSIAVVDCNATNGITPALYTPMQSGDTLIKLVTPTTIITYHNANGTRTVCTQEGVAKLIKK